MFRSFVAIGDSFTEGLSDELRPDGRYLGWADRVADVLAEGQSDFRYANLAIRGKLIPDIRVEQAPIAACMRADLVSVAGGVNDAMRRSFDLNRCATALEQTVRILRESGSEVLLFAFGDPSRRSSVLGTLRRRLWELNSATRSIAAAYECRLVDFWGVAVFDDDALWDEDRLHLSPAGHGVVTGAVLETLGLGDGGWRTPARFTHAPIPVRAQRHATWAARHGLPWVGRRIRGVSSGQDIAPKRPTLAVYPPTSLE